MLKYSMIISFSEDDQAYIVSVPELPGCMADGKTPEDAVKNAQVIIQEWIETALEDGEEIPKPALFTDITVQGGDNITLQQKIELAYTYKGISQAELARGIGTSPQAFNQRMKTGKFTSEELNQIANFLGCKYTFQFEFEDGTII